MAKIEKIDTWKDHYKFYCPACKDTHYFNAKWKFDGNFENPTLTPSLYTTWKGDKHKKNICHMYITAGRIQYLRDCTHKLAGKTVQMMDFEDVDVTNH